MASQLIYTSAPRLLEAGRTGFGTVARHRAVSGLLVSAVERVSQFARSPGLNPRRVVMSHRVIHAGAASYHVFSCIRDAGSDYTGRTNHLAHHLIAEAREVRAAAESGLSPADVLRQMRWITEWREPPRFLPPAEEISLTSFHADTARGAWERVTGNAAHALLPVQTQRCLLLMRDEEGALDLFSESLGLMGGFTAWQVSFSTHVEPADDQAELRWLALAHDSVLRPEMESGARSHYDLTVPEMLPVPKLPEVRTSHVSLPTQVLENAERHLQEQMTRPKVLPLPPLFEEQAAHRGFSPWWLVTLATGVAALVGLGIHLLTEQPSRHAPSRAESAESVIELGSSVDALWQKHHVRLEQTRKWLKAEADEQLVKEHRRTLEVIQRVLREPLHPVEISLPPNTQDDFTELVKHARSWQAAIREGVRDPRWSGTDPQDIYQAAQTVLAQEKSRWSRVTQDFTGSPTPPETLPAEIHAQILRQLSGSTAPETGTPAQWRAVLTLTRTALTRVPEWLAAWEAASRTRGTPSQEDQEKMLLALDQPETPVWLRDLIHKQMQTASAGATTLPSQPPAETVEPKAVLPTEPVTPADGPNSPHMRIVVIESQQWPLAQALEQMPMLPMEADMRVALGAAGQPESALTTLRQLGAVGVYRKSFNDPYPLEFYQRKLGRLPNAQAAVRLVARKASGAQVLFEVVVLPQSAALVDAWPSSPAFTFRHVLDGTRTYLDEVGSRWIQSITVVGGLPLRLQHVDDPACRYRLSTENSRTLVEAEQTTGMDSAARSKLAALDQEAENLRQGIRMDEQHRAALENSNLAKAQKEERARRLDDALTLRQQRLLQLTEDRKALLPEPPQFLGVRKGIYSLFAGLRRLCEIKLEVTP